MTTEPSIKRTKLNVEQQYPLPIINHLNICQGRNYFFSDLKNDQEAVLGVCVRKRPQDGDSVHFDKSGVSVYGMAWYEQCSWEADFIKGVSAACISPPSNPCQVGLVGGDQHFMLEFKANGCICVVENSECQGEFKGSVGEVIVVHQSGTVQYLVDGKVVYTSKKSSLHDSVSRFLGEPLHVVKLDAACEMDVKWVGAKNPYPLRVKEETGVNLFACFIHKNKGTYQTSEAFSSSPPTDFIPGTNEFEDDDKYLPDARFPTRIDDVLENHRVVSSVVRSRLLLLAEGNPWVNIGQLPKNPSWHDLQRVVRNWSNLPAITECIQEMMSEQYYLTTK